MRRLLSAVFILLLASFAHAQGPLKVASPQELGVIKVLLAQERAWNDGNIDAFTAAYKDSPDTLFVSQHISRGHDQIALEYKKNYPNKEMMGTLGFSELEVHPLDEKFAVVLGRYHLDRTKKAGGPADGIFSLVFEKTEAGWKIVVDHTT